MKNLLGLISGLIFSLGLVLSGMINPNKVTGFLDIFGEWDFSLALVMGGAVVFNLVSYRFIFKKTHPIFNQKFDLPSKSSIDLRLVIGASLFGVGWGLIGICPGPALVNLATFNLKMISFITSMILGIFIFRNLSKRGLV